MIFSKLSAQDQKRIIEDSKNGNEKSLQLLIDGNIKSIYKCAHSFKSEKVDFNDLVQEGILGLYEAVKRFDFSKKTAFNTFATFWILNYIAEYSRRNGRTIRIPNYLLADNKKINKYKNEYLEKFKSCPSDEEICKILGISNNHLTYTYGINNEIVSLDAEVNNDNTQTFNFIPDEKFSFKENKFINIFSVLTEEEKEMLEANSGVFGQKVSYRDLAKKYNTTFQNIKTSIDRSKRKIKRELKKINAK